MLVCMTNNIQEEFNFIPKTHLRFDGYDPCSKVENLSDINKEGIERFVEFAKEGKWNWSL